MEFITSEASRNAALPFSDAVRVGNVFYLSGQIGIIPGKRELVPGGIEGETRQMMENVGRVLSASALSFDNVFKCLVMLKDMRDWGAFNAIYLEHFKADRLPARSAFGAVELAFGAAVEMEVWACVAGQRGRSDGDPTITSWDRDVEVWSFE